MTHSKVSLGREGSDLKIQKARVDPGWAPLAFRAVVFPSVLQENELECTGLSANAGKSTHKAAKVC